MKRSTYKLKAGESACCAECSMDYTGDNAAKWARKHAETTGHTPTLTISYDVVPAHLIEGWHI